VGESVNLSSVFMDENAEFFFSLWIKTRTSSRKTARPNHKSLLHTFGFTLLTFANILGQRRKCLSKKCKPSKFNNFQEEKEKEARSGAY
jgi:hypothetical protein